MSYNITKEMGQYTSGVRICTHIIEHIGPALHGDALEDGEHGQAEVVKVGDAVVGPLPPLLADSVTVTVVAQAADPCLAARVLR